MENIITDNVVGIFAIAVVFGAPIAFVILIVWIAGANRRKRDRLFYEMNMKAIEMNMKAMEAGHPLPEGMFQAPNYRGKSDPLRTGIILVAVGVGISLALLLRGGDHRLRSAAIGLIPFFIGAGYIVVHFISGKSKSKADE